MTPFAASLPVPSHHLPGGLLATSIRDALTASSFRAHMVRDSQACLPGQMGDESGEDAPKFGGIFKRTPDEAGNLALEFSSARLRTRTPDPVDITAPHPLEPILSAHLAIARPAVADGRPCVCFRELAGLLMPGELPTAAAAVLMPLAGVMPSRPWRKTRDRGSTFGVAAEPWLTMREVEAIIKAAPGLEAQRLRLAMRRMGWRPS